MVFRRSFCFFAILLVIGTTRSYAQDRPVGYWNSLLPYNIAVGVATDGKVLYSACKLAFFTCVGATGEMEPYSKVSGMADIGMQAVGYDPATATAILVYTDGNIDLFKDNTFYNIPDLKIRNVAGAKTVYQIYVQAGVAYLSSSVGIIVLDLTTHNITETYAFNFNNQVVPVYGFTGLGDYYYTITQRGLYRVNQNNPEIQNFQVWQAVDSVDTFSYVANVNNSLFLANNKYVATLSADTVRAIYTSATTIQHLDSGLGTLFISEFNPPAFSGDVKVMDAGYNIIDSFSCGNPLQIVQLADNSIWEADAYYGLQLRHDVNTMWSFAPSGPGDVSSFDMYVNNKNLWVAHGGFNDHYGGLNTFTGMSNLTNDKWQLYQRYQYAPFQDSVHDIVCITKNETDGTLYAGSFGGGLFALQKNGNYQLLKQNSIFAPSISGGNLRLIVGVGIDHDNNVWVGTLYSNPSLYVKTPDSTWYQIPVDNGIYAGPMAFDNSNHIWYVNSYDGGGNSVGGITGYDTKETISDLNDDEHYHMANGAGYGNLPSNTVYCLAEDNSDDLWIGTSNGIGIVYNASGCIDAKCDAEIPIVQYDQFAGYLFAGENVRTIAVDGANRKWVGTDNGVWLLSPDASKIVLRFTQDNSPLPSNNVQKIAIDQVTGDVYIGTEQGLVSYHGTATQGAAANQNVVVYPDPVPSGYKGTIAIKGLTANGDVRITDINGQLVYRTQALGGQAIWNGMDYTGRRPQSGVYLIFVSSSDGTQTYSGKLVFLQ